MTNKVKLANTLYEASKVVVANIAKLDGFYGECAQRKVNAVSATSDLETLIKVGKDLELISGLIAS